jgi:hypothetical protein
MRRIVLAVVILQAILCGSGAVAQVSKPRIGIMNLEAESANAPLARQATVALTAALVGTRMFEVLDQSGMVQEFVTGAARQHAERERLLETLRGEACTETQCLADLGYALEARFMVTGNLTGTQRSATVAVRLVDVFSTSILAYPTRALPSEGGAASLNALMAEVAADLVRALPGEVHLWGFPMDANVLVDGKAITWRHERPLDLAPGRHEILARRSGFVEATTTVDVEYGAPIERELALERKGAATAMFRSLAFPGLGQFYGDRPARGTFYLIAELAALGGVGYTVYANIAANSDYDDATAEYTGLTGANVTQTQFDAARAKMTDAYDKTKSSNQLALIAVGAFAGLHVVNVLDAWIGFPDLSNVRIVERPGGASMIQLRIELAGRDGR